MRLAIAIVALSFAANVAAEDMGVARNLSENEFRSAPGLPACMKSAVQSGNPAQGPSVIQFKAKGGCLIPWHWHTPTEQVMLVSGTAKVEMRGGPAKTLRAGGYARMPGKHVHQFRCTSACVGFVASDAAFDIHFVDAEGKEITLEAAQGK